MLKEIIKNKKHDKLKISNIGQRNVTRHAWTSPSVTTEKRRRSHKIKSILYGESTLRISYEWFFSNFLWCALIQGPGTHGWDNKNQVSKNHDLDKIPVNFLNCLIGLVDLMIWYYARFKSFAISWNRNYGIIKYVMLTNDCFIYS